VLLIDAFFFFQAEDGIRDLTVTGVQTCALPISLYLTFDNGIQGGKGTANYVAVSRDGGATWTAPFAFSVYANPVCIFPSFCFNIPVGPSGTPFRGPGSYPAPAFDATRNRVEVVFADLVNGLGRIYFTSAAASEPGH